MRAAFFVAGLLCLSGCLPPAEQPPAEPPPAETPPPVDLPVIEVPDPPAEPTPEPVPEGVWLKCDALDSEQRTQCRVDAIAECTTAQPTLTYHDCRHLLSGEPHRQPDKSNLPKFKKSASPHEENGSMADVTDINKTIRDNTPVVQLGITAHVPPDSIAEWIVNGRRQQSNAIAVSTSGTPWIQVPFNATLIGLTGTGNYGTVRIISGTTTAGNTLPGTSIWWTPFLGSRGPAIDFNQWSLTWVDDQLANMSGPGKILADNPQMFAPNTKVALGLGAVVKWSTVYVNENLAPANQAQARDPNWSNYAWNKAGGDPLTNILTHPKVESGEVVLYLDMPDSRSAQSNAPPDWLTDYWVRNGDPASYRIPHYKNEATINHFWDFLYAVGQKYGLMKNWCLALGEYYVGNASGWPASFDQAAKRKMYHNRGTRTWQFVDQNFPRDENGNRMPVIQMQLQFQSGAGALDVTMEHLLGAEFGTGLQDPYIFSPGHFNQFRRVVNAGLPLVNQGDAKWQTEANKRLTRETPAALVPMPHRPDIQAGERFYSTPDDIFYHSAAVNKVMGMVASIKAPEQSIGKISAAIGKFGPGGSLIGGLQRLDDDFTTLEPEVGVSVPYIPPGFN